MALGGSLPQINLGVQGETHGGSPQMFLMSANPYDVQVEILECIWLMQKCTGTRLLGLKNETEKKSLMMIYVGFVERATKSSSDPKSGRSSRLVKLALPSWPALSRVRAQYH
ncbi:hypothetical protein TNCV_4228801 [Trichonephila clavipes]|nr:hypothetical protein TNCV_4228801 [Trichonephila clavipes]